MQDHDSRKGSFAKYMRYSHLGLSFFVSVFLFTWAGIWLDGRLNSGFPWFTLLGLALGFAGGLYLLLKELYGSPFSKGGRRDEDGREKGNPEDRDVR